MSAELATVPVGRLAPSPTGAQHVGNARTYLIAWLSARSRGGKIVLRMEDIDSPRVKKGAAAQAIEDLHWMGLDWDEGPIMQSQRRAQHEQALAQLSAGAQDLITQATPPPPPGKPAAAAPTLAPGNDPRLDQVRQHLQRYRELASQGKWSEAGRELEAIEGLVKK